MKYKTAMLALTTSFLCSTGFAVQEPAPSIGVVNFGHCMMESKQGKQEQSSFESLRSQLTSLLEDTEKQINELASKFNDTEYMDGLTPEAEEELKTKFRLLNEEMGRYQNQYYQVLNQANMKVVQSMGSAIQEASEKVAKSKKLSMVVNKEACFFHTPMLDVTDAVVSEMDKTFEQANAKTAQNEQANAKAAQNEQASAKTAQNKPANSKAKK